MWADQLDWLPSSTFAPTLYGCGDSISEWATTVLAAVDDDDELVVVGASVGGFCALEIARLAPDRVRGVVLVGSKAEVRRDNVAREHALELLTDHGFEAAWREFWLPAFGPRTPRRVIERAHDLGASVTLEELTRGVRAFFDRPDLSDFARAWTRKIVAISGDHDTTPPARASEQVARDAVEGTFHLVADCGHYVNLERPKHFDRLLHATLANLAEH